MRLAHCALALLVAVPLAAQAPAHPAAKKAAAALKWGPAPDVFPKGARMAVVSGDPSQAAPFAVRLAFPAGYRIKPHTHPTAETVRVVSGVLRVGMGEKWKTAGAMRMAAGDSGTIAANMAHFAWAKGRTTIEVSAMGPFSMTYVNPSDDPRKPKSVAARK